MTARATPENKGDASKSGVLESVHKRTRELIPVSIEQIKGTADRAIMFKADEKSHVLVQRQKVTFSSRGQMRRGRG